MLLAGEEPAVRTRWSSGIIAQAMLYVSRGSSCAVVRRRAAAGCLLGFAKPGSKLANERSHHGQPLWSHKFRQLHGASLARCDRVRAAGGAPAR